MTKAGPEGPTFVVILRRSQTCFPVILRRSKTCFPVILRRLQTDVRI